MSKYCLGEILIYTNPNMTGHMIETRGLEPGSLVQVLDVNSSSDGSIDYLVTSLSKHSPFRTIDFFLEPCGKSKEWWKE